VDSRDAQDLIKPLRSVDLGSGVGNCLGNIALYTGSSSIGCEYMPNPSRLARLQIGEIKVRWQMWAVKGNQECEAIEGDFCSDSTVIKALQKADLVVSFNAFRLNVIQELTCCRIACQQLRFYART